MRLAQCATPTFITAGASRVAWRAGALWFLQWFNVETSTDQPPPYNQYHGTTVNTIKIITKLTIAILSAAAGEAKNLAFSFMRNACWRFAFGKLGEAYFRIAKTLGRSLPASIVL